MSSSPHRSHRPDPAAHAHRAAPAGPVPAGQEARQARLSTLARAPAARLDALWRAYLDGAPPPAHEVIRPPEIGTVMLRGRAGGTGAPFNLGEMTVTRCAVRLRGNDIVGHGTVQGRGRDHALQAALIDALAEAGAANALEAAILAPLRREAEARRGARAAKAEGTKVAFFTLVRGETG